MPEHSGYYRALRLAQTELACLDPEVVVSNTGVQWTGETYLMPWLGRMVPLADGDMTERILWHHYLLAHGPKQDSGVAVNYKQVPGAAIYNDNFTKRTINPMVKAFHDDLEKFMQKGLAMGGEPRSYGHASFTVRALPYIPLTFVIWQGDEEVPAGGNILFDETVKDWLCAEDLSALPGLLVHKMLR
jgi:hypothetical protein